MDVVTGVGVCGALGPFVAGFAAELTRQGSQPVGKQIGLLAALSGSLAAEGVCVGVVVGGGGALLWGAGRGVAHRSDDGPSARGRGMICWRGPFSAKYRGTIGLRNVSRNGVLLTDLHRGGGSRPLDDPDLRRVRIDAGVRELRGDLQRVQARARQRRRLRRGCDRRGGVSDPDPGASACRREVGRRRATAGRLEGTVRVGAGTGTSGPARQPGDRLMRRLTRQRGPPKARSSGAVRIAADSKPRSRVSGFVSGGRSSGWRPAPSRPSASRHCGTSSWSGRSSRFCRGSRA